jgi:CRP-like cAMP-binding protein
MPQASALVSYKNRLLASLPALAIQQLAPHLAPIDLPRNLTLQAPGQTVDTVYFLEDGVCSIVASMGNGSTVEVGLVGRDGLVGVSALLGGDRSPNRSFMQISGHGYRMKSKSLIEFSESSAPLRACLRRSVQGLLVQTAQTAACNRVHELHERLARWLLMCRDRVQSDQIQITQEILAMMLGTRRSSVTVAAGTLQKAGLITYTRGHVTIQNRAGLADAACECYRIVHDEIVRLGLLE